MSTAILLDFPSQFHTERLLIRSPRAGDGAALFEATCETLAELRRFPASLPWALFEPSLAESERFCRVGEADFLARRDLPMLLFRRDNGRLVGASGLHRFNWSVPRFELGYWCRSSELGQGLISEAARGICDFAFTHLGARRVEALPDELNVASWRVCERAGMQLEGVLRHERKDPDGTLRNTRLYAAIR
ncbi:GNAT family N-acetyltransferase [Chitinimonas taiwanensis]|jgi:RimJ/RimL family protein N-acetyltransferase|uniref:GNAT family N-acetyltransferase n=1 Tax=Chitinimonas taiwanensis TaxID=240412 RepID=UPI001844D3E6